MVPVFLICLFPTVLCGNGGIGPDWRNYCRDNDDCVLGQGDCDGDDECSGSLICGENNCREFNPNADPTADCCTNKTRSKYVAYIPGNISLIFTVPHNGYKKPDIPDRIDECKDSNGDCRFIGPSPCPEIPVNKTCPVNNWNDVNTLFIAEGARDRIKELGAVPHLIINQLHRSKMDPNREEAEATQNNTKALLAYNYFHDTIKQVKDSMDGPALLIDFHGQSHDAGHIEVGYLINKWDKIDNNDNGLNSRCKGCKGYKGCKGFIKGTRNLPPKSTISISSLVSRFDHTLEDMLSGSASLGSRIEQYNDYTAIPSSRQPCPGSDDYFNGGWIIKQYGSNNGGQMDAIQLEMPSKLRTAPEKTNETEKIAVRTKFAKHLGDVIHDFFNDFY